MTPDRETTIRITQSVALRTLPIGLAVAFALSIVLVGLKTTFGLLALATPGIFALYFIIKVVSIRAGSLIFEQKNPVLISFFLILFALTLAILLSACCYAIYGLLAGYEPGLLDMANYFLMPAFYVLVIGGIPCAFLAYLLAYNIKKRIPSLQIRVGAALYLSVIILSIIITTRIIIYQVGKADPVHIVINQKRNFNNFFIIYKHKNGIAKVMKNGIRILKLPDNGILFTQSDISYGLDPSEKRFESHLGQLKEITAITNQVAQGSYYFNQQCSLEYAHYIIDDKSNQTIDTNTLLLKKLREIKFECP